MENLYLDLKSAIHSAEVIHLNTTSHSIHVACERFYIILREQIDELFECYIGFNPTFKVPKDNIQFVNIIDTKILKKYITSLEQYTYSFEELPAIQDITQDILKSFHRFKYLLQLN